MTDEPDDELLAAIEAQLAELRAEAARNTPNERYALALALLARRADTGHPAAQQAMERLTAKLPGLQAVLERVREIQEAKHAQCADELNYAQELLAERQHNTAAARLIDGGEWLRRAIEPATDDVSEDSPSGRHHDNQRAATTRLLAVAGHCRGYGRWHTAISLIPCMGTALVGWVDLEMTTRTGWHND